MTTLSRFVFLLLALQFFSLEVSANNIDKTFHKSTKTQSIGHVMRNVFDLEGYNQSFALVVGISDFTHFNSLETKDDPIKIKDYLLNEAGFDYVHMLTGNRVTLQRLRKLMVDVLPNLMGEQDRFLFYWSGHGVTDTRNGKNFGHLPLANSVNNEFSSMLDMDSLSQWDKRMPSKQNLYLLDACFSGYAGLTGQSSQKRRSSIKQFGVPSRQVLTAGRKGEQTIVLNDRLSSVFTTAVLEGLRGKADYYKDSVITADELNNYVRARVRVLSEDYKWPKSITPSLGRLYNGGEGEFFFMTKKQLNKASHKDKFAIKNGLVSTQSGSGAVHNHGDRTHNHILPKAGLNHSHSRGLKTTAVRKASSVRVGNNEIAGKKLAAEEMSAQVPVLVKPVYTTGGCGSSHSHGKSKLTKVVRHCHRGPRDHTHIKP